MHNQIKYYNGQRNTVLEKNVQQKRRKHCEQPDIIPNK